jgi:prepilin-type processing-associated H-X9-DG protein
MARWSTVHRRSQWKRGDRARPVRHPVYLDYYGYNYIALDGRGLADLDRDADQIAFYDSPFAWADCPFASECGIWYERDIPSFLRKLGLPLHPQMRDPFEPGNWQSIMVPRVAPHNNVVNFMFADGHVQARRWDQLTWGNLNGINIPATDADYQVSLRTLPARVWPGMYFDQ